MRRKKRQIIAMGGGAFTVEPKPRLERYILAQSGKSSPSVCLLATATGDSDAYIAKFYAAFTRMPCRPTHAPLFGRTPDLKRVLLSQDVIFVGGGNTKSMLAAWREWGVPALLREAWAKGIVLAGSSAGAICWFETGVTDSWADRLRPLPCLGFLGGTCCPHFDGEAERRPAVHRMVASGELSTTLALDDGAAAHFIGRKLERIVTGRPRAGAYEVRRRASGPVETPLPVVRLTANGRMSS